MADFDLKIDGLEKLLKALKGKAPSARIGILGSAPRTGSKVSNAQVGAAHEFGTSHLPVRSFLRVPLNDHLTRRLESSGAFDPETLLEITKAGTIIPWLKKMVITAEAIVAEGFATNGFGKWAPWKAPYKSATGMILVDTTQLRNSVTSEIVE